MFYCDIKNPLQRVSLFEAVMRSVTEETGLYMPEKIPPVYNRFFEKGDEISLAETAFSVLMPIFGEDIPEIILRKIIEEALDFEIPLKRLDTDLYVLELFHGPTFAFKDVGARFLAGMLGYIASSTSREITLLVATSGDTGGAVASAFAEKEGIRVVILYPSGRVSRIQEQQLLFAGRNILAVELQGDFDDCQRFVKQAFADREVNQRLVLTSANSINIARLFPQSVYYFHAFKQLAEKNKPVVFSVPSGNFGNLTAGLLAKKMGLPVNNFIASTNINRSIPEYLETGIFSPHPSYRTISNDMDVGNPSNFQRILFLYESNLKKIKEEITGYWFTDDQTRQGMKDIFSSYKYIADPHTSVAYLGLKKFTQENSSSITGIFLATAHPGKFPEEVEKATREKVSLPNTDCQPKPASNHLIMKTEYEILKNILLD
ncbi:MAG: threonine synthase [Bacteroidales bacterium]